jgi:hypothetical protein
MANLIAFPILIFLMILQTSVISRIQLLNGNADIMMVAVITWGFQDRVENQWLWAVIAGLLVSLTSAVPFFIPLITYILVTWMVRILKGRIWQLPIISLLLITIIGTMILHILSLIALKFSGIDLVFGEVIQLILLPSIFLNLIFAIPLYWFMKDFSKWVYPLKVDNE